MSKLTWFCVGIITTTLLLIIGVLLYEAAIYPRRAAATKQIIQALAVEISDLGIRSGGGFPTNEADLVIQLKHRLPTSTWGKPIEFKVEPTNRFRLLTTSPYPRWDMFEYDSAHPEKGIQVVRF